MTSGLGKILMSFFLVGLYRKEEPKPRVIDHLTVDLYNYTKIVVWYGEFSVLGLIYRDWQLIILKCTK